MIYVITHKDFDTNALDKSLYRVICVGQKKNTMEKFIRDDIGDNIANKNKSYCELTGLYWIWKNANEKADDITGLVHYRRYFTTEKAYKKYIKNNITPTPLLSNCLPELDDNTIILPKAYYTLSSLKKSYTRCHDKNDLKLIEETIKKICPEYIKAFQRVFNSHKGYYFNMLICKRKVLNRYCEWLFPLLEKIESMIDMHKYQTDYQQRVFGFMAERLLNVWIVHNQYNIIELPTFNTEIRPVSFFDRNKDRIEYIIKK